MAFFVLVAGIAAAGIVDHQVKRTRLDRAELGQWFCVHRGVRCGGRDPHRIESAWNQRELAYFVGIALAGTAGVAMLVYDARRR